MSELEDRLRTMLRERAADVTAVPPHVLALPAVRPHPNRRAAWLVAAAVAIVLAVAAAVVAGSGNRHRAAPPATHPPTVNPSPRVITRVACQMALPEQWRAALSGGTSAFGATSALPLAVGPDGSRMLVARDYGDHRDVAVVDRHGKARSIYTVPQPDTYQVTNASMDGDYAALDVDRLPRNANGVIPSIRWLVLLDLRTGSTRVLDHNTLHDHLVGGRTLNQSALYDGVVYWDVRPSYGSARSVIKGYRIATGRTEVVGQGSQDPLGPTLEATGVGWDREQSGGVFRPLPANVLNTPSLRSDGSAFAWTLGADRIGWWAPGERAATVVRLRRDTNVIVDAVAGRFVLFTDDHTPVPGSKVLDAVTGAVATVRTDSFLFAAKGRLVGYRFAAAFKESATRAIQVDTSTLPELRC